MSLLTPLGNTPKQFWDNLIMGKCALCTMDWEDKENYNCKVIAPIPDFPIKSELKDTYHTYQMADYLMSELLEESNIGKIEKNLSLILAESLPNWENLLYLDNIKNNEDLPFKSNKLFIVDHTHWQTSSPDSEWYGVNSSQEFRTLMRKLIAPTFQLKLGH